MSRVVARDDPPHDPDDPIELGGQAPPLVRLAAVESDAVDMLADADEPETQPGLATIAFGLELDQRPADAPAQPGGGAGIDQGAPDEVARESMKLSPSMWNVTLADRNQSTPMKLPRRSDDCSSPMPSSVDNSVRWRASSCRR